MILIGLGVLFLLHTMNIFEFGLDRFWPLILISLGRMDVCQTVGNDRSRIRRTCACATAAACARRLMGRCDRWITIGRAVSCSIMSEADCRFDRTWPAILLVIGVVKLLQSNASSAGHVESALRQPLPHRLPGCAASASSDRRPMPGSDIRLPGRCAMSSQVSDRRAATLSTADFRRAASAFFRRSVGADHARDRVPAGQPAHALVGAPGNLVCPLLAGAADSVGSHQADRASAGAARRRCPRAASARAESCSSFRLSIFGLDRRRRPRASTGAKSGTT